MISWSATSTFITNGLEDMKPDFAADISKDMTKPKRMSRRYTLDCCPNIRVRIVLIKEAKE